MKTILILATLISTFPILACTEGDVRVTPGNLSYVCYAENAWRDPRGLVWTEPAKEQPDCEALGMRAPTVKELFFHNLEIGASESGKRCVTYVVHHYYKFPKTPADPYPEAELDFYREEDAYGEFSNFSGFPVFVDGQWWSTSEHYYQAQKYESSELQDWVHFAPTPMEAANRGRDRNYPKRDDWDDVKEGFMEKALRDKYTRHADLRALLLSTGNTHIYEHTTNDCDWADCGDRTGGNRLGRLLMRVRDSLR